MPTPAGSVAPPTSAASATPPPLPPAPPRRSRKYLGYEGGHAYLRRRFGALLIDSLICLPMLLVARLVVGRMSIGTWALYAAGCLTYFFLLESQTGQTIGKRAAGLRVARVDGRPLNAASVAARSVFRLIDGIPSVPLVGLLAMILSGPRRRRIGDLAAGTMVVEAEGDLFLRAPRSPLITIYPALWIGAAAAFVLFVGHGGEPYLRDVDGVCKARIAAQGGDRIDFRKGVALSVQETRAIARLPYPPNLASTRREILSLKYRYDSFLMRVLRELLASSNPTDTLAQETERIQSVGDEVSARFNELGLDNCGD